MNSSKLFDSDASRLELVVNAKNEFRNAQRSRTWEERVAAIARMNAANKIAKQSRSAIRSR